MKGERNTNTNKTTEQYGFVFLCLLFHQCLRKLHTMLCAAQITFHVVIMLLQVA